jgi:hypothetical protein
VGKRKSIYGIWLLYVVNIADGMINLVSLTALTTENLNVFYEIGMQNTSILTRSNMAVIVTGKDIVIRVDTGMYLI